MMVRHRVGALGAATVLMLTAAGCGGGDEANASACDDFDAAYTEWSESGGATSPDEFNAFADKVDKIAATEGIDDKLKDSLQTAADALRDPEKQSDVLGADPELRKNFDVCSDLRG